MALVQNIIHTLTTISVYVNAFALCMIVKSLMEFFVWVQSNINHSSKFFAMTVPLVGRKLLLKSPKT